MAVTTHRRQRRRGCSLQGLRPPIFDLQGSCCDDDPQYFDKCFIFFSSAELLTVNIYEVCGDMDLPVCIVRWAQTGTSIKFFVQLQFMGHMNLKKHTQNAP